MFQPQVPDPHISPAMKHALLQLRDRLERLGPVSDIQFSLPRSGRALRILQPASIDQWLDAVEHDPEQNLPYWAELWPSGIALAGALLEQRDTLKGKRTLEIGSGLGVTAAAAIAAGARQTVTDCSPTSLLFCRYNTLRNTGRQPRTFQFNWRRPSKALLDNAGTGFDAILAADILYESRDAAPVMELIDRLIALAGIFWLAEPGRPVALTFLDALQEAGWSGIVEQFEGPWPDPKDAGVRVRIHRLRPGKPLER
jgi:predicted nicotinamide N-methyase